MATKDITSGEKIAKVKGARFIQAKTGTMALEVAFEFTEPTTQSLEFLQRQFWLSENAIENSMETLVEILGYNGSEETDDQGVLTAKNAFDFEREVKIVIEKEEAKNSDGTLKVNKEGEIIYYPKIKYVNSLGGSGFQGLEPQKIKSALASIGFKAAFLSKKSTVPNSAPAPSFDSSEEIPF